MPIPLPFARGLLNLCEPPPPADWPSGEIRVFYMYHQLATGALYDIRSRAGLAGGVEEFVVTQVGGCTPPAPCSAGRCGLQRPPLGAAVSMEGGQQGSGCESWAGAAQLGSSLLLHALWK